MKCAQCAHMKATKRNLAVRLDPLLNQRLEVFESRTGTAATTLVIKLLEGGLAFYEKNGYIAFPVDVKPLQPIQQNLMVQTALLSEEPDVYKATKKGRSA